MIAAFENAQFTCARISSPTRARAANFVPIRPFLRYPANRGSILQLGIRHPASASERETLGVGYCHKPDEREALRKTLGESLAPSCWSF
jgi:hypothetical protein